MDRKINSHWASTSIEGNAHDRMQPGLQWRCVSDEDSIYRWHFYQCYRSHCIIICWSTHPDRRWIFLGTTTSARWQQPYRWHCYQCYRSHCNIIGDCWSSHPDCRWFSLGTTTSARWQRPSLIYHTNIYHQRLRTHLWYCHMRQLKCHHKLEGIFCGEHHWYKVSCLNLF